jgi:hypothetical protein
MFLGSMTSGYSPARNSHFSFVFFLQKKFFFPKKGGGNADA